MLDRRPLVAAVLALAVSSCSFGAGVEPSPATTSTTCANCHGTDGNSVGGMEVLAGMPKGKMLNSLKAFRNGEKPATIMHQISKGYTDAQLELIADYFSSRTPTGGGK